MQFQCYKNRYKWHVRTYNARMSTEAGFLTESCIVLEVETRLVEQCYFNIYD